MEFLIALEVFATMTIFGVMALALSWIFTDGEARKRIVAIATGMGIGYALAAVMVSPFIYYLFATGTPQWGSMYSADPIGWIIPTTYFELGRVPFFQTIANKFPFDQFESDTYFGPVLIVIAMLFARRHWGEPFARMMIDSLIIIAVLSLGPVLHVMRHNLIGLPGALVIRLPLMSKATPSRFAMYAFLIFAIITATWMSEISWRPSAKIGMAGLIVISTLPNLSAAYWARPLDTPAFLTEGTYRKYLTPGETVVTHPTGYWVTGWRGRRRRICTFAWRADGRDRRRPSSTDGRS